MRERYYTLEEANATLPWLEELLASMVPIRDSLERQQIEVMSMMQNRRGNGAASHDQEIEDSQKAMAILAQQLRQDLQEITDRGIIVRDVVRGLVDFPSQREGVTIFLCWLRGESQIEFWHSSDEGYGSRKPL